MILLRSVTKSYVTEGLKSVAVDDVSLEVAPGSFVVLAGPSGSGKSTLLHLMGALDRPTSGTVSVGGVGLETLSKRAMAAFRLHRIGFVFQAYNLIPVLNAFENIEYPLLLQGQPAAARRERVTSLLQQVGLEEHRHKRPSQMSGGQQQRVAVARALAGSPDIVLADEPTANLDSATGVHLIELFRHLNEHYRTTFVLASHDPRVIERADRVVRLCDGKVVS